MKFLWLAALVPACGFAGAAGEPSAVDGGVDASLPTDPVDSDGDGVLDSVDNCPNTPNPAHFDHDADGRGDACDPCPHLAPVPGASSVADRDGDGVGDACDPNPDTATDRIAWFDGFDDPATSARYLATPGVWVIADGSASQTGLYDLGFLLFDENLVRPAVSVGVIPDELPAANLSYAPVFGVLTGWAPDGSGVRAQGCTLRWDNRTIIANRTGAIATATAWPAAIAVGERYEIRQEIRERNHCAAAGPVVSGADDEPPGVAAGMAGLAFSRTRARYDYLFIVDQAPRR